MALKDLRLTVDEVKKNQPTAINSTADMPAYPYGLVLNLEDATLKKLGITELPEVGSEMMIRARVEVCSTSEYDSTDGGERCSMGLQITDLELGKPKKDVDPDKIYDKE